SASIFLTPSRPPTSPPFPYTTLFRSYLSGPITDPYTASNAGQLTVLASTDDTSPSAPVLTIADWSAASITLSWSGATDNVGLYRSEEHTSELQSRENLVCRLLLEKKK